MPSFVVHGLMPPLVMLASRRLDPRKVLLLWPLTYLPDLDYVFGVHRATLHNLFILLPVAVWTYAQLQRPTDGRERAQWGIIALFYLASHLVMDIFAGGWAPFWPLSSWSVYLWLYIDVNTATNTPIIYWEPGTLAGAPTTSAVYAFLRPFEVAMVALVAVAGVAWLVDRRLRARTAASSPATGPTGETDDAPLRE